MGDSDKAIREAFRQMPSVDDIVPGLTDDEPTPQKDDLDEFLGEMITEETDEAELTQITEPPAMVQSLAKKAGVSAAKAEELWKKAKAAVKKEYDEPEGTDRFFSLVTGVLKKMLKLKDSLAPGPEFLAEQVSDLIGELKKTNERLEKMLSVFERFLGIDE